MMKASKGILGLFLALFVLVSGVCVGDDSGDILDFLPGFMKRAKFGNAVAKPFFIVPGVSTPVTITVYIPEADLVADSVQLKGGTAIIGNLTDTGNKVFSLTHNFQRDNGGAINLSISATFGVVNKTIAQFEIPVLSLPTIENASQYNQNIDDMFSTLVATKDNFSVLQDSATTSGQSSIHLGLARERLLSVHANMEAIYRAETHSPSNFPRWTDFIPTFGGLLGSADNILSDRELFKKNPYDPRVAHILAWAQSTIPWDTYLSTSADRETAAWYYQTHGPDAPLQGTLKEANKVAIKQAGGQFTGLASGSIGQIYVGGWTGWLTGQGINANLMKIIDIFITNDNQMGMLVAQVQNGEAVQLPAGSHDVLFSFGGVLDRAIYRNVMVNQNLTTTVNIAPGEVKLCKYSYQDLGDLGGGSAYATSVNSSGQVVGASVTSTGKSHAFLWGSPEGMRDLGTLGGDDSSIALGINDSGQVVGNSSHPLYGASAFWWNSSSGMQDLRALSGGWSGMVEANGINNIGEIVGFFFPSSGPYGPITHACLWSQSNGMQNLGMLGTNMTRAYGINNTRQVVGTGGTNAFLWTQLGGMQSLGTLGDDYITSYACGINISGQVVGYSDNGNGVSRAFLWTQSGGMQDLGNLSGGFSRAFGVNSSGQVVGRSSNPLSPLPPGGPYWHAFIWMQSEGMKDLNTLIINLPVGVTIDTANAINDAGQIVGYTSDNRAFLLTPIP
jgi:probable HAF family extracellular repeat protein